MKRIIIFLASFLLLGCAAAVWGWSNGHGLVVPRADLTPASQATPAPLKTSGPTPARHLPTPRPTWTLTPAPTASPAPVPPAPPSPTPSASATPLPTATPGCGKCGGRPGMMCPQYCANYY